MGTFIKSLFGLGLILSLSACQFDIEDPEIIVNAGEDQIVERHTLVTLDASGSYHEKGKKLSFNWLLMSSPPGVDVDISDSDQVNANFLASSPGNYRFKVIASHGNSSNSDEIDIHVLNNSPIADAGSDVIGYKNSIVALNGSNSSDPDSDTLHYQWTFVDKPLFAEVELDSENSPSPHFTANELGDYILSLTVSDGFSKSIDYVKINIVNQKPIPVITGPNQISIGSPIQLTATNSKDNDQDDLSFIWSLISKPQTSTLTINHSGSTLNFTPDTKGPYVVQLEASDGIDTSSSTFELRATNTAPVAIITGPSLAAKNSFSIFSAATSYDLNGDDLSYSWHILEQPEGSQLSTNLYSQATLQLTPVVSGSYKLVLDIFDGEAFDSSEFIFVVENDSPEIVGVDDLTVQRNSNVQLDASASTDANGDELSYGWILVSQPENSAITGLNNMHEAIASFTPTVSGTYLINLHVEDGESEVSKQITVTVENTAPEIVDVDDLTVQRNSNVQLDASASTDANGDELSYIWILVSQPENSAITGLNNMHEAIASFTPTVSGTYLINLHVEDGESEVSKQITVTVENTAPEIVDVDDLTVQRNSNVQLDASASTDANGDELSYIWILVSQPENSAITGLNNMHEAIASFTPTVSGTYLINLHVEDGESEVSKQITVTVENTAPEIVGVDDLTVQRNSNVQLDASASTDANGDELSYSWILVSQPENSAITGLNNMHEAIASFTPTVSGTYLINLHVEDGETEVSKQITVTVENTAPVAIAEFSESLHVGESVFLDGSNSYDPDGDELTYTWTIISLPENSTTGLTDYQSSAIDLLLDKEGDYTIALTVDDGAKQNSTEFTLNAQVAYLYRNTFDTPDLNDFILHENGTSSVAVNNEELTVLPGTGYTNAGYAALDLRNIIENYTGRLTDLDGKLIISFNIENEDLEVCGACNNSFSIGLSNNSNQMLSNSYGYAINGGGYVGNRMTFSETAKSNSVHGPISNDLISIQDGLAPIPSNGAYRIEFNPYSSVWSIYFEQSSTQLNANEITQKISEFTSSMFVMDELPFLYFGGYNGYQIKFDNIQINLDKNLSEEEKRPYKLDVDTHFQLTRSGSIGDNLVIVVERDGDTVLRRNAAGELQYTYHNNLAGSYRIWLTQNGQTVSNIVEYDVPSSYPYLLRINVLHEISHLGAPIENLYWVVETNRSSIERYDASQSNIFKHNNNIGGSYYRVWLETFDGINYERVSKAIEYNVAPLYHLALQNKDYFIKSDRLITDNLVWMIQTYGGLPRPIDNAIDTESFTYEFNSSYMGKPLKVWLADKSNNTIMRSNIIEYIVEGPKSYNITLDDALLLTRSGSLGDGADWMIIKNGKQALHRNGDNELTYTFYNNSQNANIEAYIVKWVGNYYGRVSNIVKYSVP